MAQHINLIWIPELLAKAVVRRASNMSVTAFTAEATVSFNRADYIIRVLEAPQSTRFAVKAKAIELAQATGSPAQKQLVCILTMFEALSPEKKAAYILAYRAAATVTTQGAREVVNAQGWDPLQIPPRQDP